MSTDDLPAFPLDAAADKGHAALPHHHDDPEKELEPLRSVEEQSPEAAVGTRSAELPELSSLLAEEKRTVAA